MPPSPADTRKAPTQWQSHNATGVSKLTHIGDARVERGQSELWTALRNDDFAILPDGSIGRQVLDALLFVSECPVFAKVGGDCMAGKKGPHDVDVHVGNRVRVARQAQNITQQGLAHELGITFQQVQKYEKGINRISAGRLHQIAAFMRLPITFFFEGVTNAGRTDPAIKRADAFLGTREGTLIANMFPTTIKMICAKHA